MERHNGIPAHQDIIYVQQILGHKNIQNTVVYITLSRELFKGQQEYVSKVAKNVKEACALVDTGFEYVTGDYKDVEKSSESRHVTLNRFNHHPVKLH